MAKGQIKQKQATINEKLFQGLCSVFCTRDDICNILEVSKDTLLRWCKNTYGADFETVYKRYNAQGKLSVRRLQFKLAEKSATMAIWLGKQYLGQKEFIDIESTDKVEIANDMPKEEEDE